MNRVYTLSYLSYETLVSGVWESLQCMDWTLRISTGACERVRKRIIPIFVAFDRLVVDLLIWGGWFLIRWLEVVELRRRFRWHVKENFEDFDCAWSRVDRWNLLEQSMSSLFLFFFFFLKEKKRVGIYFSAEAMWENWPWINEREFLNNSDTMWKT